MKSKTINSLLLFFACAILFTNCNEKDDYVLIPKSGSWIGDYSIGYKEAIKFYIKDNKITKTGSPDSRSITIVLPFSNVTMTKYFYEDVIINNGSFSFTNGSRTSTGGIVTITGTFTSENACSGTVTYDENSSMWNADASYNWEATPQ